MNFNNFTVKGQLSFAFGLLAVLVLAASLLAIRALGSNHNDFIHYSRYNVAQTQLVTDVESAVNRRAVAARNLVLVNTPEDMAAEKQAVTTAHQDTQQLLLKLNTSVQQNPLATAEERRLVDNINRVEAAYGPVALGIVQLALDGKKDEAIAKMNKECRPLLAALLKASEDFQTLGDKNEAQSLATAADDYVQARGLLIAASVIAVAAAMALGYFITHSLVGSLGGEPAIAADLARAVAQGDLTMPITVKLGDSTSLMAQLKTMQASLVSVVSHVRESADGVASASAEIATGNNDLSSRTERQASALEETAASMEELSSTVKHNAASASQASQLAVNASTVAIQGGKVVGQVVDTMKNINDSSKKIADIISVIDGIAFQTNILALNAAVVASEVRNLAQRSAAAAKEIKILIDTSVAQVERGSNLVAQAGSTMTEVVSAIHKVTEIIGEVSEASGEQSQGVTQVGEAVIQMDQVTQQNAALVEESAAAADSLQKQAEQLLGTVALFKLNTDSRSYTAPSTTAARPQERRLAGANNVVRPAFGAGKLAAPQPIAPKAAMAATGTDDWTHF
jgi:methyl-accepting chemotaxis protein